MHDPYLSKLPYKISTLLYIIVLIIPLGFYSTYSSFDTIREDSTVLQQTGWMQGTLPFISETNTPLSNLTVEQVENVLQKYAIWIEKNKNSKHYIGTQTLQKDFQDVQTCWSSIKQQQHSLTPTCETQFKSLSVTIQEMVKSKQKNTVNFFYISLSITMLVILFCIYSLRVYMQYQMKKHAIYDHETKLFNKTYFCTELKTSCARAIRNNAPLSLLTISIDDFGKESKQYSQKLQAYILKIFGGLITSVVRESDVACRYDENHVSILLPDTSEENALVLEKRIRETLDKHDFSVIPELKFKFATAHLNYKESAEAFRARTEGLLK